MARLGDICTFQSGGTPAKNDSSFFGGEIPWITTVALNGGIICEADAVDWITKKAIEHSAAKIVPTHSIMVGTRVGVGKVAINDVPMSTSQDIISLLNIDEMVWDKTYLCKVILSKNSYLSSQARGATIKGIKIDTLAMLEIPDLPIKEQKRISAVLDRVSDLIFLRKQQLQKLDELVKARFVELFGDPVADSMKWGQLPLSHYLKSIRYGTSTPPSFSEAGYEFIRATNIKNGKIVNSDMKYISEEEAQKFEKCKVLGGEMIVVRSGVNAGDTCIITDEHCGQYAGYDMILVFTEELHPVFVNVLLNTEYMDRVVKPLTRRAAQPHLNSEQVQSLPIIQVPYDQQNQFAAFVKQTGKSKVAIQQSLDKLELLKKALMQKYFG